MSESGTCGGSGLSLFMVYSILNSAFLVGFPASNEISIVEGIALRSVIISFPACFFKSSNFNYGKLYSWGMKVTVSQLCTWFFLVK